MTDRAERAAEILEQAIAASHDDRDALITDACDGDAALEAEVRSLIDAADAQGRFLADPTIDGVTPGDDLAEAAGAVIGRYRLLQPIGEGGFGTVFMAEQTSPVNRRVALKVIKVGMDTKQVIARFEAERQALALMDHPNIARVLDAGATDTGRPYFVMELVKGEPITDYCKRHDLDAPARLDLFRQVCLAVQHAHQKGVIHRDLKPSNILVTQVDGQPVPKVIDFGIAKAMNARLTERTLFTEFRQMVGTPEYMSPEQAFSSGLDIDTRSDVYALGVLLYELLTGTQPIERDRLLSAGYAEMVRIIREEEPPRPSVRMSARKAAAPGEDSHRLRQRLRGDLDWIVMRCLEKDRLRRYETARDLAEDIRRHLENEPVEAGPPTTGYRLRKYARRHRKGLALTAAAAALVVVSAVAAISSDAGSRLLYNAFVRAAYDVPGFQEPRENVLVIEKLHDTRLPISDEPTLEAFIDELREATGVPVTVDWASLEDVEVTRASSVTIDLDGSAMETLEAALASVSKNQWDGASFDIVDGRVVIASDASIRGITVQFSYDLSELLENEFRFREPDAAEPAQLNHSFSSGPDPLPDAEEQFSQLIEIVQTSVDSDGWRDHGGATGVTQRVGDSQLLITNTWRNHREIARLLSRILRGRDVGLKPLKSDDLTPWFTEPKVNARAMKAMQTPIEISGPMRFVDLLNLAKKETGVPMVIDWPSLQPHAITPGSIVDLTMQGPAEDVIDAACRQLNTSLWPIFETDFVDGHYLLGGPGSNTTTVQFVYDIKPLLPPPSSEEYMWYYITIRDVIEFIHDVHTDSWVDNGGERGVIRGFRDQLIITQTWSAHRQIVDLLLQLERAMTSSAKWRDGDWTPSSFVDPEENAPIFNAIDEARIRIDGERSLAEILTEIGGMVGLSRVFDRASMRDAGLDLDAAPDLEYTGDVRGALEALDRMLPDEQFLWDVIDGRLTIASATTMRAQRETFVYDLSPLIHERNTVSRLDVDDDSFDDSPSASMLISERVEELMAVIMTTVDPDGWYDNGGAIGMMSRLGHHVVITTTWRNHRAIEALLKKLEGPDAE